MYLFAEMTVEELYKEVSIFLNNVLEAITKYEQIISMEDLLQHTIFSDIKSNPKDWCFYLSKDENTVNHLIEHHNKTLLRQEELATAYNQLESAFSKYKDKAMKNNKGD